MRSVNAASRLRVPRAGAVPSAASIAGYVLYPAIGAYKYLQFAHFEPVRLHPVLNFADAFEHAERAAKKRIL